MVCCVPEVLAIQISKPFNHTVRHVISPGTLTGLTHFSHRLLRSEITNCHKYTAGRKYDYQAWIPSVARFYLLEGRWECHLKYIGHNYISYFFSMQYTGVSLLFWLDMPVMKPQH